MGCIYCVGFPRAVLDRGKKGTWTRLAMVQFIYQLGNPCVMMFPCAETSHAITCSVEKNMIPQLVGFNLLASSVQCSRVSDGGFPFCWLLVCQTQWPLDALLNVCHSNKCRFMNVVSNACSGSGFISSVCKSQPVSFLIVFIVRIVSAAWWVMVQGFVAPGAFQWMLAADQCVPSQPQTEVFQNPFRLNTVMRLHTVMKFKSQLVRRTWCSGVSVSEPLVLYPSLIHFSCMLYIHH